MEEEERKTEQSIGEKSRTTTKKIQKKGKFIQKVREILAVPILGKIILILAILIVIAFFLVGTINFFHSMPNQTRDRLEEIISSGVTWEEAITRKWQWKRSNAKPKQEPNSISISSNGFDIKRI